MDMQKLAEEIIEGKRLTRKDDLSFFLDCDLDDLCKGADKIREHFVGDKVDLCSIINGRSGRCPEDCKYWCGSRRIITQIVRYMAFYQRSRL